MDYDSVANPAIEAFLETHQCLTAMPENSIRILKLLQNPNFNMRQLVKLIEQDAAIAARVIQTVNSAAYARSHKITQLDRATVYLGFNTVKEIVIATTVQSICKPVVVGKYAMRDLWDHSLGVAVLCRELAAKSKTIDSGLGFLAGILHDVGLLLLTQSEPETSAEVFVDAEDRKVPFRTVERTYFGFDHCELGSRLASAWNFPPEVTAAIAWHHAPEQASDEFRPVCMCVIVADTLCAAANVGFPLKTALKKITDDILAEMQLTRDDIDEIMERFKVQLRLQQA